MIKTGLFFLGAISCSFYCITLWLWFNQQSVEPGPSEMINPWLCLTWIVASLLLMAPFVCSRLRNQ